MASTTVAVDRLDSWKAIAGYLNCDVRTAIRWEKERRLPIHRIPGGQRQPVFAWRRELDAWLDGRRGFLDAGEAFPANACEPDSALDTGKPRQIPTIATHHLRWRNPTMAGLALIGIAALMTLSVIAIRILAARIPARPLQLTGFEQITHDGAEKQDMLTDGAHLYFSEEHNGRLALMSVPVDGGSPELLWNPEAFGLRMSRLTIIGSLR